MGQKQSKNVAGAPPTSVEAYPLTILPSPSRLSFPPPTISRPASRRELTRLSTLMADDAITPLPARPPPARPLTMGERRERIMLEVQAHVQAAKAQEEARRVAEEEERANRKCSGGCGCLGRKRKKASATAPSV
ncbi:hypothetical protein MMC16_004435 [Acarospora aff. strigata]|nr:hypothetical protein [Acarospora aff. strigata]